MTAAAPPRDHARLAYDAFAPFYDSFTRHHDYDGWTASLEAAARRAGLHGHRLLDIACGTGKSFLPFLRRGYEVTACDVAPEMLALAARKADGRARLEVHDMRHLPRLGEFDLVCLLDDAVNYLDSPDELTAALRGAAANLAPDGVVVFDANTLAAYRSFFASATVVRDGDTVLVWDGRTPPGLEAGGAAEAELLAFVPDAGGTRFRCTRSLHRQRHHPRTTVEAALAAAGLAPDAVYGMQTDGCFADGFDELGNSKAVYIARHGGAGQE